MSNCDKCTCPLIVPKVYNRDVKTSDNTLKRIWAVVCVDCYRARQRQHHEKHSRACK